MVCGGLSQSSLVFESSAEIKRDAFDALEQTQGQKFVLGTGCVTHITAAHENLMAVRKVVE